MISKVTIDKGDGRKMQLFVSDQNGRTLVEQIGPLAEAVGSDATWTFEPVDTDRGHG